MDLDGIMDGLRQLVEEQQQQRTPPGQGNFRCEDCVDCTDCRFCVRCELCSECTYCEECRDCTDCTQSKRCVECAGVSYCEDCRGCESSRYLTLSVDCVDCVHCLGCVGLDGAEFCILNEQYQRKEYFDIVRGVQEALARKLAEGWRPDVIVHIEEATSPWAEPEPEPEPVRREPEPAAWRREPEPDRWRERPAAQEPFEPETQPVLRSARRDWDRERQPQRDAPREPLGRRPVHSDPIADLDSTLDELPPDPGDLGAFTPDDGGDPWLDERDDRRPRRPGLARGRTPRPADPHGDSRAYAYGSDPRDAREPVPPGRSSPDDPWLDEPPPTEPPSRPASGSLRRGGRPRPPSGEHDSEVSRSRREESGTGRGLRRGRRPPRKG